MQVCGLEDTLNDLLTDTTLREFLLLMLFVVVRLTLVAGISLSVTVVENHKEVSSFWDRKKLDSSHFNMKYVTTGVLLLRRPRSGRVVLKAGREL